MARTEYVDVEIHLVGRDRARLLCPDRQEYVGDTRLDDALRQRLLVLEHARDPSGYGRELFGAVFPAGGDLHRGIYSVFDRARSEKCRLRLRLNIDPAASPEIHHFHWELLGDGQDLEVGRSPETVFSRYVSQPCALGPAPSKPRMLCVVAAPLDAHRYQLAPIDYDVTRRRLEECFANLRRDLEIEFLDRPVTPEKLRDRLRNGGFHLLHVHGHGTIPRHGESALVLEGGEHEVRFVTESALQGILLGLGDLKLVTLVACHGGEPSSKDDHLSGLAGSLVRRNVPAVIAMRRAISMKLGIDFTRFFYGQLAKEPLIDAAVNEARHQLYMEDPGGVEWSSPVLYMRLADGLLWSVEKDAGEGPAEEELVIPRRRIGLLAVLALAVVLSLGSAQLERWIELGELIPYPGPDRPRTLPGPETPPPPVPPPPPAIVYGSVEAGKVGVGAIAGDSSRWSHDVARIIARQLREQRPDLSPVVVPQAFRSLLGAVLKGDLSQLKGGDRTPYGMEYLLLVAETHGDHPAAIDDFPTVAVDCEMILITLKEPQVAFDLAFDHTGKGRTSSSALEQAFGRCVESSIERFP